MSIDTKNILNTISNQLANIVLDNQEYYDGLEIEIEEEQMFVGEKEYNSPNTVYVIVSFLPAKIDYEQTAIPITIRVVCEQNSFERTRNLFNDYAYKYNLYWNEDKTMQQVYELPSVLSNFNEVYEGFRTTLTMPGAILLAENGNDCTVQYFPTLIVSDSGKVTYFDYNGKDITEEKDPKLDIKAFKKRVNSYNKIIQNEQIVLENGYGFEFTYNGFSWDLKSLNTGKSFKSLNIYDFGITFDGEINKNDRIVFYLEEGYGDIEFIALNTETSISLDSQAFYNNNGFTVSKGKFGSLSINLTTYLFDNDFLNKCLAVYLRDLVKEPRGIDTMFNFKISFASGHTLTTNFKMANFSLQQRKGELPMVSITFTE